MHVTAPRVQPTSWLPTPAPAPAASIRRLAPPLFVATLLALGCRAPDAAPRDRVATDASAGAPLDAPRVARRLDTLVAPLVEARILSGAIILSRDGAVVAEAAYGVADHHTGTAFTSDTPADGGSLAKTFTAAALQWLVVEGAVDIDAPVTRYLPAYPHAGVTVAQLLSHSNGLPPYYEAFKPHFGPDEVWTTDGLLAVVRRVAPAPAFTPGTRFEYSNLGYDAAARVIEVVTGRSYEQVLRERFLDRLGMRTTFARPARFADWPGARTLGHRWADTAYETVDVWDNEGFLGASNLYFPARDLARWANAWAQDSAVPAAVAERGRARPRIAGEPSAINGLSWYCDADDVRCYYTGVYNAFHSFVYWDRARRESVVLVTNSSVPAWPWITLQRALVALLRGDADLEAPALASALASAPADAPPPGRYRDASGRITELRADGEHVIVREACGLEYRGFPVGDGVVYVPGTDDFYAMTSGADPTAAGASTLRRRSMFRDERLAPAPAGDAPSCAPAAR